MSYQIKANYEQNFLLPPSIEDWLSIDHPSRYLREFVEGLNLSELGFKVSTNEEGRPYFPPSLVFQKFACINVKTKINFPGKLLDTNDRNGSGDSHILIFIG